MVNIIDTVIGKVVVLGFYNRSNTGDDAYVECFRNMFPYVEFYCMDDINSLPENTSIVICGGGDIINDYFMEKARKLLATFTGPVYAVSVGIPYPVDARYLKLFDHVFVRSSSDYDIAVKEIGARNVDMMLDLTHTLKPWTVSKRLSISSKQVYALCLAQPVFHSNPDLFPQLVQTLRKCLEENPQTEIHLLAFNHNTNNPYECDHEINNKLKQAIPELVIPQIHEISPWTLLTYINNIADVCICMRYHSVMFSLLCKKPIIAFYNSPKVAHLIRDMGITDSQSINITDSSFDQQKFINIFKDAKLQAKYVIGIPDTSSSIQYVIETIKSRKQRVLQLQNPHDTVENTIQKCITNLSKYFHINLQEAETLVNQKGTFVSPDPSKDLIDVARFICYTITTNTDNPCLWGLLSNMSTESFCLRDAIVYIYNDTFKPTYHEQDMYLANASNIMRRCFVNVDSFLRNNFAAYHRSGWAYCISGLQNLDSTHFDRDSVAYIDTYVDRTFHWGRDTMKSIGAIPYTKPWYGFIHHTFDTSHSDYNNETLLQNEDFIESLKACKGLIVLSEYLAQQLRERLPTIPVHVLYHPTEFVATTFKMETFINSKGGIIQVGAWLRNPYSIYKLNSPLLPKTALFGKEMDLYFPPQDYLDRIESLNCTTPISSSSTTSIKCICRSFNNTNKFIRGVVEMLTEHLGSVTIIPRVSNDAYDDLLARNVVFLDLVDCSAANTVIECIVRNTPLIVKRHPALVEILGPDYPGFFNTIEEASTLIQSYGSIYNIHLYLTKMNKTRFTLEYFVNEFQKIIVGEPTITNSTYNLFQTKRNLFEKLNLHKYLPRSFERLIF